MTLLGVKRLASPHMVEFRIDGLLLMAHLAVLRSFCFVREVYSEEGGISSYSPQLPPCGCEFVEVGVRLNTYSHPRSQRHIDPKHDMRIPSLRIIIALILLH